MQGESCMRTCIYTLPMSCRCIPSSPVRTFWIRLKEDDKRVGVRRNTVVVLRRGLGMKHHPM